MGSMTDDEYTSKFLELLRYVPHLKEEKAKIERFPSGLSMAFKDTIEFDEPRSLEETLWKLKHCYKQSKYRTETKLYWIGNAKNKGKWDKKRVILQDLGNKENVAQPKRFNVSYKGQGHRSEEQNKEPM